MKNPQKDVLVLQHHRCENLGTIADALKPANVRPRYIRSDVGEPVPKELGDAAGLVIMGGPQSVYEQDKFPYLRDEIRLIEDALRRDRPVLGTCLGSQLLAAALGAKVYPGRKNEIGWYPVTLTDAATGARGSGVPAATGLPKLQVNRGGDAAPTTPVGDPLFAGVPRTFAACHWHGDVFDLPRGVTHLAASELTAYQAFRHGENAYALLFHMEVTEPQIAEMVTLFADELHVAGVDAGAMPTQTKKNIATAQKIGAGVYQRWTALLE
jgi:GMP synthase (glutamine-hydrolysing)